MEPSFHVVVTIVTMSMLSIVIKSQYIFIINKDHSHLIPGFKRQVRPRVCHISNNDLITTVATRSILPLMFIKIYGLTHSLFAFLCVQAEVHDITLKDNDLREVATTGVLQLETAVLATIAHEETHDLASAEQKAEEDRADSLTRQIGDSFCDIVVSYLI